MKIGTWFYGLGTALTGILDIAWGTFEASHEPIKSLGKTVPAEHILAYVVGVSLVASGLACLSHRGVRIGAAISGITYSMFAALWLARYYTGVHTLGWRFNVLAGVSFGLAQQVMLVAGALIVYASSASLDSRFRKRAAIAGRWMLGLPPLLFGIFHFIGIRVFANIVPHWMLFGYFWVAFTGIAFFLAGCAICSGVMDVVAAKLLALMLLVFEASVEILPLFAKLHYQAAWGAAVYNVVAIGACWVFADYVADRAARPGNHSPEQIWTPSENPTVV